MLDNEIPRLDGQATEQKNCISPVVAPAVQEPRKRGRKRQHVARQAICYMGAFKKNVTLILYPCLGLENSRCGEIQTVYNSVIVILFFFYITISHPKFLEKGP